MTETISWAEARRIALRSQGMGPVRRTVVPSRAESLRSLRRTLEHTHLLQIDSVSVFARAHHLPVFTRTGSWDARVLDRAARPGADRLLHEAFAHEAAFTTARVHRLLAFRRSRTAHRDWGAVRRAAAAGPQLLSRIVAALEADGPMSAAALSRHLGDHDRGEGWGWRRTESQWAVEYLFRSGSLDCIGRSAAFERLYLPAKGVTSEGILHTVPSAPQDDPSAVRELMSLAARALGIASLASLADYFRLRQEDVRPAIEDMLTVGEVREVRMDRPGGAPMMLLHHAAPEPRALRSAALVSPFDPIVFHRPRTRQLFDVDYRIGIYTPAQRRTTGYYSLPFLLGDRIPFLVDLRADRPRGILEVCGIHPEAMTSFPRPQRPREEPALAALAGELHRAATWQGLGDIEIPDATGPGAGSQRLAEGLRSLLRAAVGDPPVPSPGTAPGTGAP